MHPVWLHRLENGETRLCLYAEPDHRDPIADILQGEMPKKAIAKLRDLDRCWADEESDTDLVLVVWDELPTMIAKALAAKKT